jgi:hypothetical protein
LLKDHVRNLKLTNI